MNNRLGNISISLVAYADAMHLYYAALEQVKNNNQINVTFFGLNIDIVCCLLFFKTGVARQRLLTVTQEKLGKARLAMVIYIHIYILCLQSNRYDDDKYV